MGIWDMKYGFVVATFMLFFMANSVYSIGANWGTQATHPLPPSTVVKLLQDNGIQKVKLFDADPNVLKALSGSGIEVMVGIPNDMLYTLANSLIDAQRWVHVNVSSHMSSNNVDIRYVAVGNEPFLTTYNGTFLNTTYPAMRNIQAAITQSGLSNRVKVTIPLNADVYQSSTTQPSTGDFRQDIHDLMVEVISFMSLNGAPFTVNIYPFISLYNDPNFPFDYAFFDGYSSPIIDNDKTYKNVFDANYDTLVWALEKNGYGNLSIIVGEIGWPTDGDQNANIRYAQRFNQGVMSHMKIGTPMRPGPIEAYLFSLVDEDAKSIQPGNFERHWGIFNYDGTPKYNLSTRPNGGGTLVAAVDIRYFPRKWCVLSPTANVEDPQVAPSVSYACARADCTSLGYGTSCSDLDARGNISYAFNSYYQENNQLDSACQFPGLSVVTTTDPSVGTCRFGVMIQAANQGNGRYLSRLVIMFQMLVLFLIVSYNLDCVGMEC